MRITELTTLSDAQVADLLVLMHELDPEVEVTEERMKEAARAPSTHLFAALKDDGHIAGCASLCVFESPTGRKASIEDVVVGSGSRRQGIGRALMEHLIDFARRELAPVDLHLTSRPSRIAANEMYRALGFQRRETNAYRMVLSP